MNEPLLPTDEIVVDVELEEELFLVVDDEPASTVVYTRAGAAMPADARLRRVGARYHEAIEFEVDE